MGFDLYGIAPANKKELDKHRAFLKAAVKTGARMTKKQMNDYTKAMEEKGAYFRNNIWWWPLLWGFAYTHAVKQDILTIEDFKLGSANNGHRISKSKATKLGRLLLALIADGTVKKKEKDVKIAIREAKKHNAKVESWYKKELKNNLTEEAKNKLFSRKMGEMSHAEYYAFDVDNVREFAEFCLASGGFRIC